METFEIEDLRITLEKQGARAYEKVSYPLRYGRFSEIKTVEHLFQLNLNGELKFITGRGNGWPHPSEWLKRTVNGDWVYYSTGGYDGPYDAIGEYYLPCLPYPTNSINSWDPFSEEPVRRSFKSWARLHKRLSSLNSPGLPGRLREFFDLVVSNPPPELEGKSGRIDRIIGDEVTVLPPDARHVDYDVIPLMVADGCLYRCGFCRVKSRLAFKERSKENIEAQIKDLKALFGRDIANYNSLYLGQHDALNCPVELLEFAAERAFETFGFDRSNLDGPRLFLFGSVDSLIALSPDALARIERLPFRTFINIGFESADGGTLGLLRKGITQDSVATAFAKAVDINRRYEKIEVTSNFVFGPDLPESHIESFLALIQKNFKHPFPKGAIYFSPMINGGDTEWKRRVKREFYRLKVKIPVPSYLYLIQRL